MRDHITSIRSTFKLKGMTAPSYSEPQSRSVCAKYAKHWINFKHFLPWLKPWLIGAMLLLSPCVKLKAHTYVAKGDSLALVDLYNATNGKNWTMRGYVTWNLNQPVDTWN